METILAVFAGDRWQQSHLTYSLGGSHYTEADAVRFTKAFDAIAAVCGLTFERVTDGADMAQNLTDAAGLAANWPEQPSPYGVYTSAYKGYHYGPGDDRHDAFYDRAGWDGPHGEWLAIHEILHGVGLEHPHTSIHGTTLFPGVSEGVPSTGAYGLATTQSTVMAYGVTAPASGPMAFDIFALQTLYGANMTTATGNNEYAVGAASWRCIWDAGGIDAIRYSSTADCVIDLRPATLQIAPGGGGYVSQVVGRAGGLTIAYGVEIENAYGGSGDNAIYGNAIDNRLYGAAGNDSLYGFGGADILVGSGGTDRLYAGIDSDVDRLYLRNTDIGYQFDSAYDLIDLAGVGVLSVAVATIATGRYQVSVQTDGDATAEHVFEVRGDRPGQADFWY